MENYKSHIRTINLKYHLQHGMEHFTYLMDHILYQISKIFVNIYLKKHGEETINSSVKYM